MSSDFLEGFVVYSLESFSFPGSVLIYIDEVCIKLIHITYSWLSSKRRRFFVHHFKLDLSYLCILSGPVELPAEGHCAG